MRKVLFVCHGNICRSTMAECIFEYLIKKNNLKDYYVDSAATSREEIGNSIYYMAKSKLISEGIPVKEHYARQITIDDYNNFDLIIIMDEANRYNINRIIGDDSLNKVHLLLDYTNIVPKEIEDPWYSNRFDKVYDLIYTGCIHLLDYLERK